MSRARRRPCPHCNAPIRVDAFTCAYCRADVTGVVRLDGPVLDSYARDGAARGLVKALRPTVTLTELVQRLAAGRSVLTELSHFEADVAVMVLAEHGISATVDMSVGPPSSRALHTVRDPYARRTRRRRLVTWALGVLATLLFGGGAVALVAVAYMLRPGLFVAPPAVASAPSAAPQEPAASPPETVAVQRVAAGALPGVVAIRCAGGVGSGFFVSPNHILTNRHVVRYDAEIVITLASGKEAKAKILRSTSAYDAALLEVIGDVVGRPLPLASSQILSIGQRVVVIGSPVGLDFTVHEGTISNLQRELNGARYFQLDARINPGNSGGPVLDLEGRVVGLVTMKAAQAEGIGLATPVELARRELEPF